MGENPIKKEGEIDDEFTRAQRSMKGRVDPDEPVPPVTDPVPPVKPAEVPPVVTPPVTPKADDPVPPVVPSTDPVIPKEDDKPIIKRPEAFIPLPKYLDEKKQWELDKQARVDAEKRISELEALGNTAKPATEDDISKFAEKHSMDVEMVKELLVMAESRVLPAEKRKQLDDALKITDQRKHEDAVLKSQELFKTEFNDIGKPEITKLYPNATPEQLEAAQIFLDGAAHTATFADKELPYVIYKLGGELAKIFTTEGDPAKPTPPNKGMEPHKTGQSRVGTMTAKDFEGKTDFSDFLALDQSLQDTIRKEMDTKTYSNFLAFISKQDNGVEVTRGGRKITLK